MPSKFSGERPEVGVQLPRNPYQGARPAVHFLLGAERHQLLRGNMRVLGSVGLFGVWLEGPQLQNSDPHEWLLSFRHCRERVAGAASSSQYLLLPTESLRLKRMQQVAEIARCALCLHQKARRSTDCLWRTHP